MIHLFVYGTLKKQYQNHYEYLYHSEFLGSYKTEKKFPLVIANKRFSPVLIDEPGLGNHVIGEVYAINQDTLYKIDALERTNMNKGYFRKEIQVIDLNHNKSILCYTYFKQRENLKVIHSEYLESYSDTRYKKK